MTIRHSGGGLTAAALGLALLATACTAPSGPGAVAGPPQAAASPNVPADAAGPFPVLDVIDGDTARVERGGHPVTVRLIGVDAPETVHPNLPVQCFGPQASDYTTQLLNGRQVKLEYDPAPGRVDRYGRELAYLWLPDGQLANLLLIDSGHAREADYGHPYRHAEAFRSAQDNARAAGRGLWDPQACP